MDASGFVEWAWAVPDDQKPELAKRVALNRADVNEQFLREARATAEATIEGTDFDPAAANASAAPEDWMEDGRDMEAWNSDVGNDLRSAYEDVLLAIGAKDALGKAQRRVLAEPLLPEVPGLPEALGLA